jgi:hypothetical protein
LWGRSLPEPTGLCCGLILLAFFTPGGGDLFRAEAGAQHVSKCRHLRSTVLSYTVMVLLNIQTNTVITVNNRAPY